MNKRKEAVMIRTCVIMFLAFLTTGIAQGQLIRHIGGKVAYTSAGQNLNSLFGKRPTVRRSGVNVAGYVEWLDIPVFSVITQVEYSQRGAGEEFILTGPGGPEPLGTKTLYWKTDYLSVPVLAKARYDFGLLAPYVLAGPRADFRIGSSSDEGVYDQMLEKFEKTMLGASVGAGVETSGWLPVTLLVEFRYNIDFKDSYSTESLKIKSEAWDLWLGVGF